MDPVQQGGEKQHTEESSWIMDPSGHYHLRDPSAEVAAYSLIFDKKNGNDVMKEKRAAKRISFEHKNQFGGAQ